MVELERHFILKELEVDLMWYRKFCRGSLSKKLNQHVKKDRLDNVKVIGLRDQSEEFLITVLSILFPHYTKNEISEDVVIHDEIEGLLKLLRFFLDRQDLDATEIRKIEIIGGVWFHLVLLQALVGEYIVHQMNV